LLIFLVHEKLISLFVLLALFVMETVSERQSCAFSWGLREGQLRQSIFFTTFAL
jgi:hypothetical protein